MRIYLPMTLPRLAAAVRSGELGPATLAGYAVTPALREWYASGDAEELEYAALTDAARDCLRLLAADPAAAPRRVVVAADIPDGEVVLNPQAHPAAVLVGSAIRLADVASAHVDDPAAAADVQAAAAAIVAADSGDPDAQFTVDGVEDHELAWYATQELAALVGDDG